jgi:hypothetical protein
VKIDKLCLQKHTKDGYVNLDNLNIGTVSEASQKNFFELFKEKKDLKGIRLSFR